MEISYKEHSFIIDCGILFPYEDTFDINYLIPNFTQIEKPSKVFITHGHEDHIGALPHLIEKFPNLEIQAPPFAAALIKRKCDYYPRKLEFSLKSSTESDLFFGLEVHYIQVNHSIPDTFGILLIDRQEDISVFYISDFKVDPKAKLEPYFDFKKLVSLTKDIGTRFLLADSTNITSQNLKTPSEEDLLPQLDHYLSTDIQRVFVTTFSSNIHRLKNIVDRSVQNGRKVIFYGRSMQNYWQTAFELGIVDDPDAFSDVDEYKANPDQKYCILVSGCQGDFRSTFRRIAYGHDSYFKVQKGDLFLLSSKAIPGNEKKITMCLNELSRQGVDIVTANDDLIHASGHPGKEDLETVLAQYNPHAYIPIHGETFFLSRHEKWIESHFPNIRSFSLLNHESFDFIQEKVLPPSISEEDSQPLIIHGNAQVMTREEVKERRKIAEAGKVIISYTGNSSKLQDLKIQLLGIPLSNEHDLGFFENGIKRVVAKNYKGSKTSDEQIRIQSRKLFKDLLGLKPVVTVISHHS